MSFSDRMKLARKHADLTQKEVADAVGISQSAVSQAEAENAEGSAYTAQIARACGVSAYWLATGDGNMIDAYTTNRQTQHVLTIMENLPPEFKDQAVRVLDSLAELSGKVSSDKQIANG
jgi:transcriptional regulator with XRE-family HTH domain